MLHHCDHKRDECHWDGNTSDDEGILPVKIVFEMSSEAS